jgi:deoxyribose-phosphate aldolase
MMSSLRRTVRLEHRLTRPNASLADLDAAVALATEHELAALTVSPWLVSAAQRRMGRSRVSLGTVVAYPHGGQLLSVKAFEASKALESGASQIDFVLNGGALLSGDDEAVLNDMLAVVDMAHSALAVAGVIIEVERLPDELLRKACRLAERAGADYVVSGTESVGPRVAVGRTRLLRDTVGPRVQVKAAGRFRTAQQVDDAAAAGATRVSCHLTGAMLRAMLDARQPAGAAR